MHEKCPAHRLRQVLQLYFSLHLGLKNIQQLPRNVIEGERNYNPRYHNVKKPLDFQNEVSCFSEHILEYIVYERGMVVRMKSGVQNGQSVNTWRAIRGNQQVCPGALTILNFPPLPAQKRPGQVAAAQDRHVSLASHSQQARLGPRLVL